MIGTIMENPTADSAAGRSQSQKRKTEKPQMLRLCGNISRYSQFEKCNFNMIIFNGNI